MRSEIRRFGRGFVYAWNGIRAAVQQERNFRFHLCAACYALAACALAELQAAEWCIVILCIAAVLGMELMNSAVERAVDKPDTTHWWSAGAAKDMAAGGVLFMALGALAPAGHLGQFVPYARRRGRRHPAAGAGVLVYLPLPQRRKERRNTQWQNRSLKCPAACLWRWLAAPMWANPA